MASREFLALQNSATAAQASTWSALLAGDLPAATAAAQGAVVLDGTAGDIQPLAGAAAAGSTGKAADAGHVHPNTGLSAAVNVPWLPADNNLVLAVGDPVICTSNGGAGAGTVYLAGMTARAAVTVTNIVLSVVSGGTGASTQTFAGLYNSAGTLLSGSADVSSHLTSAGYAVLPLTTPQAVGAGAFVWAAVLFNFATTQPGLSQQAAVNSGLRNPLLTPAGYKYATYNGGVGGQIALPASLTPANNGIGAGWWMGCS